MRAAARAARGQGRRLVVLSPEPEPLLLDGPVPADFALLLSEPVSVVALTLTERPQEEFAFVLTVYRAVPAS